jgi:hypothetical protein
MPECLLQTLHRQMASKTGAAAANFKRDGGRCTYFPDVNAQCDGVPDAVPWGYIHEDFGPI